MKFGAPYMAIWLWLIPAMIFFYIVIGRAREKLLRKFASGNALKEISSSFDIRKRKVRNYMMIAAILFMTIALMRPQWGFSWQEVRQQGLDIIIALDTSNSMLAEDVLPSRLERAKLAIRDLVKKIHGDRIGLVVFAGTAFLQCPLTIDYNGFLLSLDDVDPDTIPIGGTSLAKAIYKSMDSYEGGKKEDKILIVITDGEDLEGGLDRAIQQARADNVKIFCVGIGSTEGELIPVPGEYGKSGFLKDKKGNVVRTRLTEGPLEQMAIETGGMYIHATGAEFGLDLMYEEKLSKLQKKEIKSRRERRYFERFQIPLIFAIFLLFLEPAIGDRKKEKKRDSK
jgi:Ca-activated chloride channel family protein